MSGSTRTISPSPRGGLNDANMSNDPLNRSTATVINLHPPLPNTVSAPVTTNSLGYEVVSAQAPLGSPKTPIKRDTNTGNNSLSASTSNLNGFDSRQSSITKNRSSFSRRSSTTGNNSLLNAAANQNLNLLSASQKLNLSLGSSFAKELRRSYGFQVA